MAVFLMLIAAVFVSVSNFFMRKSIDSGGTTKGFLVFQMAMAFFVAVLLNPIRTGQYAINAPIIFLGVCTGLLIAGMLFFLGRSLESGPPGLTFSILNASTVMPAIAMAFFFGFPYTAWHGVGSVLVLGGLFWAGKGLEGLTDKKKWIVFAFAMFFLHILVLMLFQWRALLLNHPKPQEIVSFFTSERIQSQWFMPCMFLAATVVQLFLFISYEKRLPLGREVYCGLIGGTANGICTYLMVWSTEVAAPLESAIIFPVFSVAAIVLSNLWGQKLYQEKVNWRACQLCTVGLILGTVDWKAVTAAIGF